jgi:hypothetical protein
MIGRPDSATSLTARSMNSSLTFRVLGVSGESPRLSPRRPRINAFVEAAYLTTG